MRQECNTKLLVCRDTACHGMRLICMEHVREHIPGDSAVGNTSLNFRLKTLHSCIVIRMLTFKWLHESGQP
jgi:hypothetical protein